MTRRPVVSMLVAVVSVLVALLIACNDKNSSRRDDDSAPVVDTEIMAFLSEARALHHTANMKEDANDLEGAIVAMNRLVAARRPHANRPPHETPEVEEVLADTYARLGELQLKKGDLDTADVALKKGLERAPEPTYFRGHLIEVQGLVEEQRTKRFVEAGNKEEADKSRARAIALLEEVVKIQSQVIERSLGAKDAGVEASK